jgi:HEPN domain-containing protein
MTKDEHIKFWMNSSEENFTSMRNMFSAGEYMWALFIGHLAIEKLLKAYYVKTTGDDVPRTHDLYRLAAKTGLEMTEEQKDTLQYITLFNIETRYEDYKKDFYKKCTREFTEKNITSIEDIRTWLKQKIKS